MRSLRLRAAGVVSRCRPVRRLVSALGARWLRELALAGLLLGVAILAGRAAPWANAGQRRHFAIAALGVSAVVMFWASMRAGLVKRDLLAAESAYLCFMVFASGSSKLIGGAPARWLASGELQIWLVLGFFVLGALMGVRWLHTASPTVSLSLVTLGR
jgi:hypothetical protein